MNFRRISGTIFGIAILLTIVSTQAGLVILNTNTQFQTIRGWVAIGGIGLIPPAFPQPLLLNRGVNELGVTTLRLDLPFDGISATQGRSWDPWADYTVDQMYDFLSHYKLPRKPGSKMDYSNFGMGLLGHILALKAGTNYEALIVSRICDPLHMKSTRIALSPEMKSRVATGHSAMGPSVKNWGSLVYKATGRFIRA
jgi:hypothetical protein